MFQLPSPQLLSQSNKKKKKKRSALVLLRLSSATVKENGHFCNTLSVGMSLFGGSTPNRKTPLLETDLSQEYHLVSWLVRLEKALQDQRYS